MYSSEKKMCNSLLFDGELYILISPLDPFNVFCC